MLVARIRNSRPCSRISAPARADETSLPIAACCPACRSQPLVDHSAEADDRVPVDPVDELDGQVRTGGIGTPDVFVLNWQVGEGVSDGVDACVGG